MSEFITWEFISSFVGVVAATCILTEVIKFYIKIDAKYIALLVAGILSFGYGLLFVRDFSAESIFMIFINWIFVTGAAIGLFEGFVKNIESFFMSKSGGK